MWVARNAYSQGEVAGNYATFFERRRATADTTSSFGSHMALKPCRECGEKISSFATTCPKCGKKHPTMSAGTALGGLVYFAVIIAALHFTGSPDAQPRQSGQTVAEPSASTPSVVPTGEYAQRSEGDAIDRELHGCGLGFLLSLRLQGNPSGS
jgi:hypothetical protein